MESMYKGSEAEEREGVAEEWEEKEITENLQLKEHRLNEARLNGI